MTSAAAAGPGGPTVARRVVNAWSWQDAFGFVQAHEARGAARTVYCAGQTSVDEESRPIHAGDVRAQVRRAPDNLETVLAGADVSLGDVVRLDYFTTDVGALLEAWEVVAERLARAGCRPASTLLGVQALAFPELMVEIEATAVAGGE